MDPLENIGHDFSQDNTIYFYCIYFFFYLYFICSLVL